MALSDGPAAPAIELRAFEPAGARQAASDVFAFHDPCVLGTRASVYVRADGQGAAYAAACAVRREIDRLDRVFNWRDARSELSVLNSAARRVASDDLFVVVSAAERWRELSAGAYSGRLGRLLELWRTAQAPPDAFETARLAREIADAPVRLDHESRLVIRPEIVRFDLDGLAKGYIVDRALAAAMAEPGVFAAMVDIGGDIRCAGAGPEKGRWRVNLPDPLMPFDNASALGSFALADAAIATSGCGPRDRRVGTQMVSATLDPRTGWPVAYRRSASAIAASAMDADALATTILVSKTDEARALIARTPGMAARVARPAGADWFGADQAGGLFRWIDFEAPQKTQAPPQPDYKSGWEDGWIAKLTFNAPPKDMRRDIAFRSPYVAIWVSDPDGKPVRTLLLIGTIKEWQENNHVWWRLNRGRTTELLGGRSMSTRGSGVYKVYWDGVDDAGRAVTPGRYVLHVETSRERGGHTHRTIEGDFSRAREFALELPVEAESGGLELSFEKF